MAKRVSKFIIGDFGKGWNIGFISGLEYSLTRLNKPELIREQYEYSKKNLKKLKMV